MMKIELEKFVEFLLFLLLLLSSFYFVQDVWINYKSNDIRFFLISCQIFCSNNTLKKSSNNAKYYLAKNEEKSFSQCEDIIKKI